MNLQISGFKAHNHAIRLDPLLILSASNGAGKSAVAESIRFLALGYVPGLGKRPQDTASLMRGSSMTVSLDLDDGRRISRRLEETSQGYRTEADCSWLRSKRSTAHAKEILSLFGRDDEEVAESLDIRQLLSASPMQREARIAALLASSGGGVEETLAEAMELARAKEPSNPALDAAERELEEKLRDGGLDGALTWANLEKRRYASEVLAKTHVEHEIEERLAQLPRVSAQELRALEQEAAALDARGLEVRRHRGRLEGAAAALSRAEQQEEAAREARQAFESTAPDRPALRRELAEIDREADALLVPPQADPREGATLLERAETLEAEARSLGDVEVPELEIRPLPEAAPSPWDEVAEVSIRLIGLARKETSPFSYQVLTDAQRLEQLSRAERRQEQRARSEELRTRDRERYEQSRKIQEARERRERRDALLRRAAELRQSAQGQALEARRALVNRRAQLRQTLSQADAEDRGTALALERATLERELRRRHLAELGAHAPAAEEPERLDALRREIERLAQARAARMELERTLSERGRVEGSRAAAAALEWALQRIRERRLDQSGSPLIQGMTRFLRAGGRREVPFLEASRGSCRIGWRTPQGGRVLIQTLSGGEWTLFAAALAASLLQLRAPALRFLLVEAGEADPETLRSLLAGLRPLGGEMSSVIVLTHLDVNAKGWTVLRDLPLLQAESA